MQLRTKRAELLDEGDFREVMDVLGFRTIEPGGIGSGAGFDFIERAHELRGFVAREDAGRGDGSGPGAIEGQLLRKHPAIEMPGALEFVEGCVWGALKAPAPHFVAFGSGHRTAASNGTVIGSAKRLMKPSASLGL